MLHKETTSPFLYQTLKQLMQMPEFYGFRLVDGTGLSLQLGHRKNIDIDLFSENEFPINDYKKVIRKVFYNADIRILSFGLTAFIPTPDHRELKIDLMQTEKYIRPPLVFDTIRLAKTEDIAALKLEAITSRNTKKDFYDIAELLEIYSLQQMLGFYKEKYPYNDVRDVLENITFFSEDCESEFEPVILNDKDWVSVKFFLEDKLDEFISNELQ